jgi:hypothetical protein
MTGFVQNGWTKRLLSLAALLAMTLLIAIPSAAGKFPRQPGIKVLHYRLDAMRSTPTCKRYRPKSTPPKPSRHGWASSSRC